MQQDLFLKIRKFLKLRNVTLRLPYFEECSKILLLKIRKFLKLRNVTLRLPYFEECSKIYS